VEYKEGPLAPLNKNIPVMLAVKRKDSVLKTFPHPIEARQVRISNVEF
jgi:hypothetical protein